MANQDEMPSLTRRSFIAGGILCSADIAMSAANIQAPHADFPTDPRARLAVATYPFRRFISAPSNHDLDPSKPAMDLPAFARMVREKFNVGGIEPLDSHFPSTERSAILKLRASFDALGVRTVNMPVDEPVMLCSPDASKRNAGNARYREWIDIAGIMGSPSIRIWIPKCSDTSDLPKAVEALRPTLDYASAHNIVINLENDDPVLSSDARVLAAIHLADTPYLRTLPDFANSLMGGDERFNARAVKRMFAHAWNIAHVKDAELIHGKRETVSLSELFGIAKAARYRGYYSMESDSDADPFRDTQHLIEESLRLM